MASVQRRFGPADRSLAEDLAERAAIALDNARLYHDIQENDRRKNEFLAMLSHELRNPLAPVRNAVHVLRQCGIDHPQLNWARDLIDRQVTHLVRLVDDLLDVSRITRGKIRLKREHVDMAAVVASAVETSRPLIQKHGHELTISVPEQQLWVQGDSARLAQIFSNLLNNATKYTPDGGSISIIVAKEAGEIVVTVRDTGAGIPGEMLSKVFDLFTQIDHSLDRSQGGLGVGLTLVQRLVELHGGTVHAFSKGLGQGSEFVVRLHADADDSEKEKSAETTDTNGTMSRFRQILVVDDNRDAADSLVTTLRLAGHNVGISYDGLEALEAIKAHQPEVVLLDIGLPGLNGYEVARRLRAQPATRNILLVAVSGYGQDTDRQRSREAGFDHHLTKPIEFSTLEKVLCTTR